MNIIHNVKIDFYFQMFFTLEIMSKDLNSFFKQINDEHLFYKIDIMEENGSFQTSWEKLSKEDYTKKELPSSTNRIIMRVQKAKNHLYFLDFFQQYQDEFEWYGFQFKTCIRYEFQYKEEDDWFDAVFYFNHPESKESSIHICNVNREIILLLQQFFQIFT